MAKNPVARWDSLAVPPRLSRASVVILTVGVSAVAALLCCEGVLRLAGVSYPRFFQRDANRGTSYRPGIKFRSVGEGGAQIAINAEGFRDRDHPIPHPPDTVRIAVLGDSYVEAGGVAVEDRFTDRLERELAGRDTLGGKSVEVLSFGMSGYGTAQELQVLRHHTAKYAPDVVILAFLPFNDVRNNYEPLEHDDGKPYFLLRNDELVLDDSFRSVPDRTTTLLGRTMYWAVDHLRLVQLAYESRRRWTRLAQARDSRDQAQAEGFVEYGLQTAAFIPPQDGQWAEAWHVTEALIRQMHRDVRRLGASFLVAVLTAGIEVDPDPMKRKQAAEALGVGDLLYAERRVCEFSKREGIECLPLGEPLQEYATKTGTYLHGFSNTTLGRGHWNEAGNALASNLIARALVDRQLLPERRSHHPQ